MNAGAHRALTMAEYLALPAVSSGVIRAIVDRCPAAGWYDSYLNPDRAADDTDASDVGTVAHEIVLEGSWECVAVIDPANFPAKNGNVPDGWKNPAIREARDAVRARGKIPMLPKDLAAVQGPVESARRFIDGLRNTEPAIWRAFQPGGGHSELTMLWDESGVACKLRADRITTDHGLIVDLKFTNRSAKPQSWARSQVVGMGYYVSAAFYRRGVKALFNVEPDYVFLVVECEPPYLCSLVGVDPAGLELGARKVTRGLKTWRECVEAQKWPAYPNRVCYVELPAYEFAGEEEVDDGGIPYDVSALFRKSEVRP